MNILALVDRRVGLDASNKMLVPNLFFCLDLYGRVQQGDLAALEAVIRIYRFGDYSAMSTIHAKEAFRCIENALSFAKNHFYHISADLLEIEKERMDWALATFPESTAQSSLNKCREEIREIEADIQNGRKNPEEYADAMMCLFDSAGRQGITPEDILMAYYSKLQVNKRRKWSKNPDNSYSHLKVQAG